jgi:methyltransferase
MVVGERGYLAILALLCAQRLVELGISGRNSNRMLAHGGLESGQGHYRTMVAMHGAWLLACAFESIAIPRTISPILSTGALTMAAGAQALRYWAIWTLGERWNTRIIVIPGAMPVTGGPYRFLRHPNYVAVMIEIAAIPLIRANWYTAVGFSIANAMLMAVRIPAEERAMGARYRAIFAARRRLTPL